MNYNTAMTERLSELLEEGETLLHPFFGYLRLDEILHSAFFRTPKTHLPVHVFTKTTTYSERIPSNGIRYIQIKQSGILKKFTVNITPSDHSSMQIVASPSCKRIRNQRQELPLVASLVMAIIQF